MVGEFQSTRATRATQMQEEIVLTAPLGIRFRDEVSASTRIDSLSVIVYSQTQPHYRTKAYMTPGGVYALHNVPGMQVFDNGWGDNNAPKSPAMISKPYIVEVVDTWQEARFLPFCFSVQLPYQGLYRWEGNMHTSSTDTRKEAPIPLYSAPTRSVAGGMAVLRAELQDATTGKAASWAMLEAQLPVSASSPAVTVRGLADEQGRVALIFPFPMPVKVSPTAPDIPLEQQEWQIPLQARYMPLQTQRMLLSGAAIPDLQAIVKQPVANLWENFASRQAFSSAILQYGRESIAHSQNVSVLLITTN